MPEKPSDLVKAFRYAHPKNVGAGPTHGYGISVRIEQMSKAFFASMRARCFLLFTVGGWVNRGEWGQPQRIMASSTVVPRRVERDSIAKREWGGSGGVTKF
jgi:hypothetical protein